MTSHPADVRSVDPRTSRVGAVVTREASLGEVQNACNAAAEVAAVFGDLLPRERAAFLCRMATELESDGAAIVATADAETALGDVRLSGELARTCAQLRLFAHVLKEGAYLEAMIDRENPDALSGPRPDIRRMLQPLGPVVVFAASNFPLAFSVAGGDTASALAAGCPVLVKAHPSHPATSERSADAIRRALASLSLPDAVFLLLHGFDAGRSLVLDPNIRAVAFTGSQRGGRALFDLAAGRPDPIPFYGELGSINPVFVTPGAARRRAEEIAQGFVASFTLGNGQFCTKPGILLIPAGEDGNRIIAAVGDVVRANAGGWLLNEAIHQSFCSRRAALRARAELLAEGSPEPQDGFWSAPIALLTSADALMEDSSTFFEECFGPLAIVATYRSGEELREVAEHVAGSLTAAIHEAEDDDEMLVRQLAATLARRVGRLIWNGFPTGVAVTWAMHHGGPYPATIAPAFTSVGAMAIRRFLRPVAFQGAPERYLPLALRDANPLGIVRRVDDGPVSEAQ